MSESEALPMILLGSGGHARVLLDVLRLRGRRVLFAVDADAATHGRSVAGIVVRGGDDLVQEYAPDQVLLVHGVGSVRQCESRCQLFERMKSRGYGFARIVHPSAVIASSTVLGEGVQILAGAVVQPDCRLDENVIVNTNASVDHDGWIGRHAHVGPGATLCGGVVVGERSHVGTGATIVQGRTIGARALIGAGAVVLRDVPDGATAYGVPARLVGAGA